MSNMKHVILLALVGLTVALDETFKIDSNLRFTEGAFYIDGNVRVSVVRNSFVDIRVWNKGKATREAMKYNSKQWDTFVQLIPTIERYLGIHRVDRKGVILSKEITKIQLYEMFNGEPSIIDFKTAKKIKKREWIEDYFLQGCAYALAHNEMFESKIKQVAILMIDREGKYADFVIRDEEFDQYCEKWADRLATYYS